MKHYIVTAIIAIVVILAYHYFGASILPSFGKKSVTA
jgi:hypothetical protein